MKNIKLILILTIISLFFGSMIYMNFAPKEIDTNIININTDTQKEVIIQQCRDGLDNDGDGYTDFPFDTDCSSETDNSEKNNSILFFIIFIILLGIVIYYFYNKNKNKINEETLLSKPISMDVAYKHMISWFIKKYGEDIPKFFDVDEESKVRLFTPKDVRYIEEVWRERDDQKETGNIEYYCGIQVNIGRFHGFHIISTSLSKGLDNIINGNITFRKGNWIGSYNEWRKLKSTFNPSSLKSDKDRMTLIALESGDETDLKVVQDKFKIDSETDNSKNSDLDDFEKSDLRKQNMAELQNNKKSKIKGSKQRINQTINNLGDEQ